jgi:uncharacterized protein YcaQ
MKPSATQRVGAARASNAARALHAARASEPVLISTHQAACMVLACAALSEPRRQSSAAQVARMVKRLGYVQVDSIIAVERAHDTILRTRLAGYRGDHLRAALERDRSLFEHWTHDASLVPIEWLPYWHKRFRRHRERLKSNAWWRERGGDDLDAVFRRVLRAVQRSGPLRTRDLAALAGGKPAAARKSSATGATPVVTDATPAAEAQGEGWWNWSPEKAALESLWRMGRVAIAHRQGFEKSYDLFERVHPERAQPGAKAADHLHWACAEALERLGVATHSEIARFFNDISKADVARWARTAGARELAVPVLRARACGGKPEPALAVRALLRAPPPPPEGVRVLSPFDPVVRDRQRLERVWGFTYRFEAFVPAAKRVDGYYTLPVLAGSSFIGRCALRTDRARSRLVLERWRSEGGPRALPAAVRRALEVFADEIGVDGLECGRASRTVRP